ncbi:hypothetical protein GCM10008995_29230 [Halobellus salinus]|uniref:Uncharacterized protein n=1 Tax=Halobellus salinus TaxID=931585 RepID=A0A830ETZ0_9EURY|nr:hypothetical protein [Halobellus salinus]GGJ17594.1 hypothetical protein GCM10008995_29230 [Halobellus salinus]SMP35392.1 hypothetical protein SAMN06265347_1309 [Halobellus salinus]
MPKTIADYEDAVRRIAAKHVPADATTEDEVRRALSGSEVGPQVTRDVLDGIAENLLTEDRVLEAIEDSGELPSEGEIDAIVSVADDYDMDDRVETVEDAVRSSVATVEDVQGAVRDRQDQAAASGRPTFREDVEGAVDEVAETKQFVGESPDEVTAEQAREIGAPSETAFRGAAARTIANGDQVNPSEVLEDTRSETPVSVIRDTDGGVVAATGAQREELGEQVAEQYGVEYMSAQEVEDSLGTRGTGDRVSLTLGGRKVGEVDVE